MLNICESSQSQTMPRIRKKVADLKNRIADSLIQVLDGSELAMLETPEEWGEPEDISQAVEIIRNALNRRKSN